MILQKSLEIARVFSVVVVLRYQKLQSLEITAKMSKGSKGPNQMESSFQIPINTPMLLQGGRKHRMRPRLWRHQPKRAVAMWKEICE